METVAYWLFEVQSTGIAFLAILDALHVLSGSTYELPRGYEQSFRAPDISFYEKARCKHDILTDPFILLTVSYSPNQRLA